MSVGSTALSSFLLSFFFKRCDFKNIVLRLCPSALMQHYTRSHYSRPQSHIWDRIFMCWLHWCIYFISTVWRHELVKGAYCGTKRRLLSYFPVTNFVCKDYWTLVSVYWKGASSLYYLRNCALQIIFIIIHNLTRLSGSGHLHFVFWIQIRNHGTIFNLYV